MFKGKLFDLIVVAFIMFAGLFTAYVCFGILKSQADANIQGYSVSGAIAGALISWSLLTTLYMQIRKSSEEFQKLRERNEELQQKLIRGAPRPKGFEIEVSERQRIVLARPKGWEPFGGTIFNFELLDQKDIFPARFSCSFMPIKEGAVSQEEFYKKIRESFTDSPYIESYSSEFVYLGGESHSIKSQKIISREYICIELKKYPVTGKVTRTWWPVTKEKYDSSQNEEAMTLNQSQAIPYDEQNENFAQGRKQQLKGPGPIDLRVKYQKIQRMKIYCYNETLNTNFFFEFIDDIVDFPKSSAVFNQILASTRFLA